MHTPSTASGYALGWDSYGPPAAPTRLEHSGNLLTFSAYQAVLPESGYGIALLFNSGSAFLLEQTAIFRGALHLVEGTDRTAGRPRLTTTTLDVLLGCLTVFVWHSAPAEASPLTARPGQAAPRLTVLRKGRHEESP
jgi:Beta-lactamase